MPFATRAMLHERTGGYIEETEADAIELQLDLLAHHYWHSENMEKKREYLVRAGEAAQASYANTAAIDYFERAAPLVAEQRARRRAAAARQGASRSSATGSRAEQVEREALAHAELLGDARSRALVRGGARRGGTQAGALRRGARACSTRPPTTFESVGDDGGARPGPPPRGHARSPAGRVREAVASYEASLEIRERLDDKAGMAALYSNLGVVAEYRGDYGAAREYHEQALGLRAQLDDRRAIAVSMTNLGTIAVFEHEYEEARECFEDAMRLNREVGDAWMVAISDNNLGNATRGLGDYDAAQRALRGEPARLSRLRRQVGARVPASRTSAQLAALRGELRARLRARRSRRLAARGDRLAARPGPGGGAGAAPGDGARHARGLRRSGTGAGAVVAASRRRSRRP